MNFSENSPAASASVVLTITSEHLVLSRPSIPAVRSILEVPRRSFVVANDGSGVAIEDGREALYQSEGDDDFYFSAGLLPRVVTFLQRSGYHVSVRDQRRVNPRLLCNLDVFEQLKRPSHQDLARAVSLQPLGQIEVANRENAIDTIEMLARVFSEATVGIGVATQKRAHSIWRSLQARLFEEIGRSGTRRLGHRIEVGTIGQIVGPENWSMLLLYPGEDAISLSAATALAIKSCHRLYALVQPQRRRDHYTQLKLEQLAGQVIHRIKKPRVAVHVAFVTPPRLLESMPAAPTPLERKRNLYWHNDQRNAFLARLAKEVVAGNDEALQRRGIAASLLNKLPPADMCRVVLLVESAEHGRQMHALLPTWQTRDMVPAAARDTLGAAPPQQAANALIVTELFALRCPLNADVVIRATGLGWPLRLKEFPWSRTATHHDVLVIDLADEGDDEAQRDTRRRRQDYQRQGILLDDASRTAH